MMFVFQTVGGCAGSRVRMRTEATLSVFEEMF